MHTYPADVGRRGSARETGNPRPKQGDRQLCSVLRRPRTHGASEYQPLQGEAMEYGRFERLVIGSTTATRPAQRSRLDRRRWSRTRPRSSASSPSSSSWSRRCIGAAGRAPSRRSRRALSTSRCDCRCIAAGLTTAGSAAHRVPVRRLLPGRHRGRRDLLPREVPLRGSKDSNMIDDWSRVYNQRYAARAIEQAVARHKRYQEPFSAILVQLEPALTGTQRPQKLRGARAHGCRLPARRRPDGRRRRQARRRAFRRPAATHPRCGNAPIVASRLADGHLQDARRQGELRLDRCAWAPRTTPRRSRSSWPA